MSAFAPIPETLDVSARHIFRNIRLSLQPWRRHDSTEGRRKMVEILMQHNLFRPQDQCAVKAVSQEENT